jgi:hypothetical protein
VDSIAAVLVAPICSLLAASLHTLIPKGDRRVESFTEEEENALQLLTSLRTLHFLDCPGLPSLPQGLHGLPSLRILRIVFCPEIQSLPKGGLPSSLREVWVSYSCTGLHEQVKRLKGTNRELVVDVYP